MLDIVQQSCINRLLNNNANGCTVGSTCSGFVGKHYTLLGEHLRQLEGKLLTVGAVIYNE